MAIINFVIVLKGSGILVDVRYNDCVGYPWPDNY